MIVLDTHIWLKFILGDESLRSSARKKIESKSDAVIISSISIWEAILLAEKKRLILKPKPTIFIRNSFSAFPFRYVGISPEISLLSRELEFNHQDPADRFIAATAHAHQASLMTDDAMLKKLKWLKCC